MNPTPNVPGDPSEVRVSNLNPEEVEEHFAQVKQIHAWMDEFDEHILALPHMKELLVAVSEAQTAMAKSAESMANTFKVAEERYQAMEARHADFYAVIAGKDQIPLKSHYYTLLAALVPVMVMAFGVIFAVLYFTKYDLKASLSQIEVNQKTNQRLLQDTKDAVKDEGAKNGH